ncbi:hypothetical protein PF005_g18468 [Phytophthora fragariae]|uniref:Uncharacterized protein n=1 Tax=Phytophthora fragariae TaxID=53985 RepID=A0A6A3JMZ6_9STRA|nr:hypothetical protein PF003_g9876 [Phytophthora fragariae]KAE8930492.1 hypothetical protein PF009_g19416 [Phytophthora fragariae]KAE8993785.1 hypothetical protein PF011_g16999 [Phytophthora fragariae]KAE9092348.1 hypothetical protein PF007_g18547 [Phytophthora fragariae]KAE9093290.1 hypothetical protein PF010_g17535 [Phytophthora fragariae]
MPAVHSSTLLSFPFPFFGLSGVAVAVTGCYDAAQWGTAVHAAVGAEDGSAITS